MKSGSWLLAVALVASLMVVVPPQPVEADHVSISSSTFTYSEEDRSPGVDLERTIEWQFLPGHVGSGDTFDVSVTYTQTTTYKDLGCGDGTPPDPVVYDLSGDNVAFSPDLVDDPTPWYLSPDRVIWKWVEGTSTQQTEWIETPCPGTFDQVSVYTDVRVGTIQVHTLTDDGCWRMHHGVAFDEAQGFWDGDFAVVQVGDSFDCFADDGPSSDGWSGFIEWTGQISRLESTDTRFLSLDHTRELRTEFRGGDNPAVGTGSWDWSFTEETYGSTWTCWRNIERQATAPAGADFDQFAQIQVNATTGEYVLRPGWLQATEGQEHDEFGGTPVRCSEGESTEEWLPVIYDVMPGALGYSEPVATAEEGWSRLHGTWNGQTTQVIGEGTQWNTVTICWSLTQLPDSDFDGVPDDEDPAPNQFNADCGNHPPVAVDDLVSVPHDQCTTIEPLADNGGGADYDPDGDTIFLSEVGTADLGVVTWALGNSSFIYCAPESYLGPDSVPYTIVDGEGGSGSGVVQVNVFNTPPVANNDYCAVDVSRSSKVLDVVGTGCGGEDIDPDSDELTVSRIVTPANYGSVSLNSAGQVIYTPPANRLVLDEFIYEVTDGFDTDFATVLVEVSECHEILVTWEENYESKVASGPVLGVTARDAWCATPYGPKKETDIYDHEVNGLAKEVLEWTRDNLGIAIGSFLRDKSISVDDSSSGDLIFDQNAIFEICIPTGIPKSVIELVRTFILNNIEYAPLGEYLDYLLDQIDGLLEVVGLDGCYDQWEPRVVNEIALSELESASPDMEASIVIHEGSTLLKYVTDERVAPLFYDGRSTFRTTIYIDTWPAYSVDLKNGKLPGAKDGELHLSCRIENRNQDSVSCSKEAP